MRGCVLAKAKLVSLRVNSCIVLLMTKPHIPKHFPPEPSRTFLNVLLLTRVPMNLITCGALLCLHVDAISNDKRIVFGACLLLSGLGMLTILEIG